MNEFVVKEVSEDDLGTCTQIIREGFATVANDFNLTQKNYPTNGAFIKQRRLKADMEKGNCMYGLFLDTRQIGFVQLDQGDENRFDMKKLTVLPRYRHLGGGKCLLDFIRQEVKRRGGSRITIGILEENVVLKEWYLKNGFVHTGTRVFDHLPFTVGFMQLDL